VRELHCWAAELDEIGLTAGICLKPDGHDGPCVWTPVGEVSITFAPADVLAELAHALAQEEDIGAGDPPLDQIKRARNDPYLPGLAP